MTIGQEMVQLLHKGIDMSSFPAEIPVDYNISRYDPDEDEDDAETNFSLASTLHDFSYEFGRRYPTHRFGSQIFPSDDLSVKNEKILHHLLLFLFEDKLFLSPIESRVTILDVKCCQGLWSENVAEMFPDAEIVAMDTTLRERSTYPNIEFLVQNFNDEWILDRPNMKFDFVYGRNLFGSTGDFPYFYKQAFDNIVPGGYFEQFEMEINPRCDDGSSAPDSMIVRLADITREFSSFCDTEFHIAPQMARQIGEAGFVDVVETRYKCPLGTWSADPRYKQIGEWFEAFYKSGLQGWCISIMTKHMGFTPEQVNDMCEQAFKELDERKQHFYFDAIVVHARKPT